MVISYKSANKKEAKAQITQLRNIGEGGMAFGADRKFEPGEILEFYIRLPLASEAVKIKGKVADSCMMSSDLFCLTRVEFIEVNEEAKKKIRQAVEYIKKELSRDNEDN